MSVATPPTVTDRLPSRGETSLSELFSRAYGAQLTWSQLPIKERISKIRSVRNLLVHSRRELAQSINLPCREGYRETLTSEILPLADAVQWVTRHARRVLEPRYCRKRHTPFWLGILQSTVYRVPHGLVLIIGAGNYPLFLTGVQLLQALVAGNAVAIKPAPGAEQVTEQLVDLFVKSGVPEELIVLLDSSVVSAQKAMETGVDKVILTGSSRSGRAVLKQLADSLTPATLELSGCDAVYVLPGADMHRVCDVLMFGMRLNGGATCMAPRRVFIPRKYSEVFHRLLAQRLTSEFQRAWRTKVPRSTHQRLWDGIESAIRSGARIFESETKATYPDLRQMVNDEAADYSWVSMGHMVLTDMKTDMSLCSADIFAPLIMVIPVEDWADILQSDSKCPYALTVSIYGPVEDALRMTDYVSAGTITINDSIVPTADPQLPFGGRGESGFGVTRGDEGLLEMTVPRVISIRKGSWLPHATPPTATDETLLDGLLQWKHSETWMERWRGIRQTILAAISSRKLN